MVKLLSVVREIRKSLGQRRGTSSSAGGGITEGSTEGEDFDLDVKEQGDFTPTDRAEPYTIFTTLCFTLGRPLVIFGPLFSI